MIDLLYVLILLVVAAAVYGYKLVLDTLRQFSSHQQAIYESTKTLARAVNTLQASTAPLHEPQFTCYFCNNKFPISQRIEISNYSYCEEHANRGHITRSN